MLFLIQGYLNFLSALFQEVTSGIFYGCLKRVLRSVKEDLQGNSKGERIKNSSASLRGGTLETLEQMLPVKRLAILSELRYIFQKGA